MQRKIAGYFTILLLMCAVSITAVDAQQKKQRKQGKGQGNAQQAKSKAPGKIQFTAKNSRHAQSGTFANWKFTKIDIPGGDIEKGTVELEIDLTSISTKSGKLTNHLKSPDFFDVAKYAKATLTIKEAKAVKGKAGTYTAKATISIRKASVDFPITFTHDSKTNKVSGNVNISRNKLTVGKAYNKANANSVEDGIKVKFEAILTIK